MKILVVEDNAKLNEGIKLYLEENGFEVDNAFNGVQALSKVKDLQKENKRYEVIIMDRMMPMKDGIETMREIKNLGIESSFIILTAKDTVDDKIFGLAAGADDYIVKPFNVRELVARIHSLYRRNLQREASPSLGRDNASYNYISDEINTKRNEDFILDVNSSHIIINKDQEDEKTIPLTNKEIDIFRILLEANSKIVSKEKILEIIWKEVDTPGSRFVDVHVHNLRNKLINNDFPGKIETVRNGYLEYLLLSK